MTKRELERAIRRHKKDAATWKRDIVENTFRAYAENTDDQFRRSLVSAPPGGLTRYRETILAVCAQWLLDNKESRP